MNFLQAYEAIVKASIEQDTKEIPLILSCINFTNQNCLEIGTGPFARLAIKIANSIQNPRSITGIEQYEAVAEDANQEIKKQGLENTISVIPNPTPLKLPYKDNRFDIIYAGWIPSDLLKNQDYLNELARVSKNHILLVMSGEKGDIPVMRDLIMQENGNKSQSESQKRIQLRESLTNHFISLGYKIDTSKETTLRLDFPDKQTIRQVFYCLDFNNKLIGPEKEKVNEYLDPRTHDFKDHLYLFHAWKK